MRHSTLSAIMPCESSSVIQNSTNGIEPVRNLLSYKKAKNGTYEKRPPMPTARVLAIFEEVVAGIAYMHSLSPPITHRDLKLENVLVNANDRFVLCDFGSAVTTKLPAERTRKQAVVEEEVSETHDAYTRARRAR